MSGSMRNRSAAAMVAACGMAGAASAQTIHPEVEPNDNKTQALANGPIVLQAGDTVVGASTGALTNGTGDLNTADYFLFQTVPAPLGVYRHRLLFGQTGTAGHFRNFRGLGQWDSAVNYYPGPAPTGSGTDDFTANFWNTLTPVTVNTPARTMKWYGFGRAEKLYDRVTGGTATTGTYTMTYDSVAVTPVDLGTFAGGLITISTAGQGHNSDTELWVYDADLHPIPGFNNDNVGISTTAGGANSTLTRDFVQGGVYYLALGGQNLANTLPSPTDDKMRSVFLNEFQDMLTCSSHVVDLNCAFSITDGAGAVTTYPAGGPVNVIRGEPHEILWYRLTLTAPAAGACCRPDGSCTVASAGGCAAAGGTFTAGAPCVSVSCAQPPLGACCGTDGACTAATSFACAGAGGTWRGAGSACPSVACDRVQGTIPGTVPGPVATIGSIFFDVTAGAAEVTVTGLDYYTSSGTHSNADGPEGRVYVHPPGTYLFNTQSVSHTEPPFGWVVNTDFTFPANPGAWTALHVALATPVTIPAGQTVGFKLATRIHGIRIGGLLNPGDPRTFSGPDVTVYSEHGQTGVTTNYPYWAAILSGPRILIGRVYYAVSGSCYPNCDGSTQAPVLNVADFGCFLTKYAAGDAYANCDESTQAPVLNV
ncbi:MAG: hypothetical protein WD749_13825, partial [Phycisphaerales bacterium]